MWTPENLKLYIQLPLFLFGALLALGLNVSLLLFALCNGLSTGLSYYVPGTVDTKLSKTSLPSLGESKGEVEFIAKDQQAIMIALNTMQTPQEGEELISPGASGSRVRAGCLSPPALHSQCSHPFLWNLTTHNLSATWPSLHDLDSRLIVFLSPQLNHEPVRAKTLIFCYPWKHFTYSKTPQKIL